MRSMEWRRLGRVYRRSVGQVFGVQAAMLDLLFVPLYVVLGIVIAFVDPAALLLVAAAFAYAGGRVWWFRRVVARPTRIDVGDVVWGIATVVRSDVGLLALPPGAEVTVDFGHGRVYPASAVDGRGAIRAGEQGKVALLPSDATEWPMIVGGLAVDVSAGRAKAVFVCDQVERRSRPRRLFGRMLPPYRG